MKSVGAYDAKTHLSALLDEVALGNQITITRHGRPVAKIIPFDQPAHRQEAIDSIRQMRSRVKPISHRDLLSAVNEGRR